jgi:hypothetical protein
VVSSFYTLKSRFTGGADLHLHSSSLRVTPQSTEAFIIRLYREKNQEGFLKAFSDQPEHMTAGMSPLKDVMTELQVRTVHIFPRYAMEFFL